MNSTTLVKRISVAWLPFLLLGCVGCQSAPEQKPEGTQFTEDPYRCDDHTWLEVTEETTVELAARWTTQDLEPKSVSVPLQGQLRVCDVPCGSDECLVRLRHLELRSPPDWEGTVSQRDLTEVSLVPWSGHPGYTLFGEASGGGASISVPEGAARIGVSVSVDGRPYFFYGTNTVAELALDHESAVARLELGLVGIGDETNTLEGTIEMEIVNRPPVADAGGDREVVCDGGPRGTEVHLDGSSSSDPDGDDLIYRWRTESDLDGRTSASGQQATFRFGPGRHEVTLQVSDGSASNRDTIVVDCRQP